MVRLWYFNKEGGTSMRLVAYCRVSTNKNEQLESLSNQQEFFQQFAKNNNHTLIKMYSDEGISGKQMNNRKEFLRLMEDAKLGLFDLVAVKDVSRFARNTVDFLVSIRELKSLNIDVLFLSTNQTILGGSEFVLTMFSALAQEESANLSSRVKFGKKVNAKNGKVPNYIYGYNRVDKFNLEINEDQANVIRDVFDLYVNKGMGSRRIAITLTERHVPTYKNAARWIPKTVRRMLENELYKGVLISKKTEVTNYLTGEYKKLKDVSEYTFNKPELAIVDEEIFNKAQILLQKNKEVYKNEHPNGRVSTQYPFSTLIKCEHCGYSFTRRIRKLKYRDVIEWKCAGRNNNDKEFCPNLTKINEEELLNAITDHIYATIKDKEKFLKNYECAKRTQVKKIDNSEEIEKEISKLEAKKKKYMDLYVNEIIDIASLKSHVDQIDKELDMCRNKLLSTENHLEEEPLTADKLYSYMKEVLGGNYSNVAMKKIIDVITVNDKGEVKIIWK